MREGTWHKGGNAKGGHARSSSMRIWWSVLPNQILIAVKSHTNKSKFRVEPDGPTTAMILQGSAYPVTPCSIRLCSSIDSSNRGCDRTPLTSWASKHFCHCLCQEDIDDEVTWKQSPTPKQHQFWWWSDWFKVAPSVVEGQWQRLHLPWIQQWQQVKEDPPENQAWTFQIWIGRYRQRKLLSRRAFCRRQH